MAENTKPNRGLRSPGYPVIDLETAIQRVLKLKEYAPNRKPIPVDTALAQWSYKPKSGAGLQVLASVKKYGLIEDSGQKDQRTVKVTNLAWKILTDPRPESPSRCQAIRQAAMAPVIHQDMRERWPHGLPDDTTVHVWLVQDKKFNEKYVKRFLTQIKATFEYAKLDSEPDVLDDDGQDGDQPVKPGDWVQWTSGGVARFKEAKEVTTLSDDGLYAFVKGERTGMLVEELTLEQPPMSATLADRKVPPPNPNYRDEVTKQPDDLPLPLMMHDGTIRVVHIPRMDESSFEFLKTQLEAYRTAIVVPKSVQP